MTYLFTSTDNVGQIYGNFQSEDLHALAALAANELDQGRRVRADRVYLAKDPMPEMTDAILASVIDGNRKAIAANIAKTRCAIYLHLAERELSKRQSAAA